MVRLKRSKCVQRVSEQDLSLDRSCDWSYTTLVCKAIRAVQREEGRDSQSEMLVCDSIVILR